MTTRSVRPLGGIRGPWRSRGTIPLDLFPVVAEAGGMARGRAEEVLQALDRGEIIEEYPDDVPYPSCLVLGRTATGRPIHVVCAPVVAERRLIVITTYQPDPARWDQDFRRRRQP